MKKSNRNDRRDYLAPDKYLSLRQIQKLRSLLRKEADAARRNGTSRGVVNEMIVELMLEGGLRAQEICLIQIRDLPFYHGKDVLYVRKSKYEISRTVYVKSYLNNKLQEFVKGYRRSARPGSPLFVNERGNRIIHCKRHRNKKTTDYKEQSPRLAYHSLYGRIKRIGIRAGIPYLHPHVLRHTFATHLHAVEHDLLYVQQQLGHSRPETTSRYAHVIDKARIRQTERLYSDVGAGIC
ncbi:MAG: site-specific integrase [Phycisphaerae bacterium]|nr:site-specific integrase [Phycisphaerae bacterium]